MDELGLKKKKKEEADTYALDVQKRLENAKRTNMFSENAQKTLRFNATTRDQLQKEYAFNRFQVNALFWGYAIFVLSSNVFMYSRSVRLVRWLLKVESFWPVNFAAFVPSCMVNFTLMGVGEAVIKAKVFNEKCSLYFEQE